MADLAEFTSDAFTPDRLIAGNAHLLISRKVTIASGQKLSRGDVLGKITAGAVTSAFSGTGNGTLTPDATDPTLAGAQVGDYKATCITAATNAGTFRVTDPNGDVLGDVDVGDTFANQIKFAIADGSTDFAVDDVFTITVAAGSGKYNKSLSAATDGSEVPDAILVYDADATDADVDTVAYFRGDFQSSEVGIGTGHTLASIREGLREKGINLIDSDAA